jgi:ferric-dicitrate binding protein FerR (iron transport regulator)
VVVTSGKVKLESINSNEKDLPKEIVLVKGEKGVIENQSFALTKTPADDPNYMSWKTHEFVFNNTNITEIVKLVSDIYDAEIKIENTNTENCNLTGRYSCYSLDDMLDMLKIVLNISVEKNGNYILIKTNDC